MFRLQINGEYKSKGNQQTQVYLKTIKKVGVCVCVCVCYVTDNYSYPAMKAETAADIQKHPYSPKLDNDKRMASNIQQTDGMLMPICQFHIRQILLNMTVQLFITCCIYKCHVKKMSTGINTFGARQKITCKPVTHYS